MMSSATKTTIRLTTSARAPNSEGSIASGGITDPLSESGAVLRGDPAHQSDAYRYRSISAQPRKHLRGAAPAQRRQRQRRVGDDIGDLVGRLGI